MDILELGLRLDPAIRLFEAEGRHGLAKLRRFQMERERDRLRMPSEESMLFLDQVAAALLDASRDGNKDVLTAMSDPELGLRHPKGGLPLSVDDLRVQCGHGHQVKQYRVALFYHQLVASGTVPTQAERLTDTEFGYKSSGRMTRKAISRFGSAAAKEVEREQSRKALFDFFDRCDTIFGELVQRCNNVTSDTPRTRLVVDRTAGGELFEVSDSRPVEQLLIDQ